MKRIYFLCLTAIFMAVAGTGHAKESINLASISAKGGTGWTYNSSLKIIYIDSKDGVDYEISGTNSDNVRVIVGKTISNTRITVTFKDAKLSSGSNNYEFDLRNASEVVLTLEGENEASITVPEYAELTIKGDGKLKATKALAGKGPVYIEGGIIDIANKISNTNTVINGNVVLFANGTIAGGVTKTKGVVFELPKATSTTLQGKVYGDVILPGNLEIGTDKELTVPAGNTLTVPNKVELKMASGGKIDVQKGGKIDGKIAGLKLTGTPKIRIIEPKNIARTDIYYGDVVEADTSDLEITDVTGIAIDLDELNYKWSAKGTPTDDITYKIVGGDVTAKSISVSIWSAYYNVTENKPLTSKETVNKKPVHITKITVPGKVYDGTKTVDTSKEKVTYEIDSVFAADKQNVKFAYTKIEYTDAKANEKAAFTIKDPKLDGTAAGYYALQSIDAAVLAAAAPAITPKPITLAASHFKIDDKVYDGTVDVKNEQVTVGTSGTSALTEADDGICNADKNKVFVKKASTGIIATYNDANAGKRKVTITGGLELDGDSKGNYTIKYDEKNKAVPVVTATITKKSLTIAPKDTTRAYGSTENPKFELIYDEFAPGEGPNTLAYIYTVVVDGAKQPAPTTPPETKFTLKVKATKRDPASGSNDNYNIEYKSGAATLTITKAKLSVIAENKEKVYDTPNPALTVKYEGLVNGDTPEKTGLKPELVAIATGATKESPVIPNGYLISFTNSGTGSFTHENYDVTFVPGILTVKPAPQSIDKLNNPGEAYEWPEAISGPWPLPLETSEKVPIVYTIEPSGAAKITGNLLVPQKSGTFTLTVTVKQTNYEAISEEHLISVTTPPQPPTLREVVIPKVPGVVTNPPAGIHYAVSGSDYTFRISPEAGREFTGTPVVNVLPYVSDVRVTANGDGSYTVVIPGVSRPVELSIAAPVTPSTGNAVLPDEQIWGVGGQLHIRVSAAGEAQIYGISGVRVKTVRCAAGETVTEVPAGIYLVRLHGKSWKVAVTD
ncbi:MAG: YDG domain-containing protein [Tannerella sp.]|jgi:hypothetical protein|nr:YDG domain-containing protein [Tannerella sp.]